VYMPAVSKAQARLFKLVHLHQQGKLSRPNKRIKSLAKSMSPEDVLHYAKTKLKGLPEHISDNLKVALYKGFMKRAVSLAGVPISYPGPRRVDDPSLSDFYKVLAMSKGEKMPSSLLGYTQLGQPSYIVNAPINPNFLGDKDFYLRHGWPEIKINSNLLPSTANDAAQMLGIPKDNGVTKFIPDINKYLRRSIMAHELWHAKNPTIPSMRYGPIVTPELQLGPSETFANLYGGYKGPRYHGPGESLLRTGSAAYFAGGHLLSRAVTTPIPDSLVYKFPEFLKELNYYRGPHSAANHIDEAIVYPNNAQRQLDLTKPINQFAKSMGKGMAVGVPISMGLDAVAPTGPMATPAQQEQHPISSYFNDVSGHWLDSTKAMTAGAATGGALSGGVGAIPGAIAGGIGDLSHKAWNAGGDMLNIGKNLWDIQQDSGNINRLQRRLNFQNNNKPLDISAPALNNASKSNALSTPMTAPDIKPIKPIGMKPINPIGGIK